MRRTWLVAVVGTKLLLACGGDGGRTCDEAPPLGQAPIDVDAIEAIVPLGLLNPPSHTFPTDHVYVEVGDVAAAVVAPGDVTVDEVTSVTYVESPFRQGRADYSVRLRPCDDVLVTFGHVQALAPAFLAEVGDPATGTCTMRETADETIRDCVLRPAKALAAGAAIGTAGGPGATSQYLDVGALDERVTLDFANPARLPYEAHVVCPLDYFAEPVRSELLALLPATASPACGKIDHDVAGTAAGNWISAAFTGEGFIEGFGLALVRDNVDASVMVASVAGIGSLVDNRTLLLGTPASTGQVNRAFADVTPAGGVFCYEGLTVGPDAALLLLAMPTADTLQLDVQLGATCGPGPWTITAAAVDLVR
jgi:hypothetical protein